MDIFRSDRFRRKGMFGRKKRGGRWATNLTLAAAAVVLVSLALIAGAGPAYRVGILPLGTAFDALRLGVLVAAVGSGLALIALSGLVRHRRFGSLPIALGALVVGLGSSAIPYMHWQQAQHAPPIHDITTDTGDPPAFRALAEARERAPNAVDYPGEETARLQRAAYPDIEPLYLAATPDAVRAAAETTVLAHGWEPAAVERDRLEATAVTTWFGFRDDVVIRLREVDGGTRVDVRSASRLGRGDAGANAARIRAFLRELELELQGP